MLSPSNQPAPFDAIRLSLQAREILERLQASGGAGNDDIFYRWLATIGLTGDHAIWLACLIGSSARRLLPAKW